MSGPFRQCGRAECRLCNPRPAPEEQVDSVPMLLVSIAMFVLIGVVCFVLLPVLGA